MIATVTIHTPDGVDVRLPLSRPPLSLAEARAALKGDDTIRAILRDAEVAFREGNPAAVVVAVRLLRSVKAQPWPAWVADGVLASLEGRAATPARNGGRHARAWTRWEDDAADYVRYRAVKLLRSAGWTGDGLYAEVGAGLLDIMPSAAVEERAIKAAYRRVVARTSDPEPRGGDPWLHYAPRYFPDVVALHLLAAADVVRQ